MKKIKLLLILILSLSVVLNAEDAPDEFDIMYVYTEAAKNRVGGKSAMLSLINNTIDKFNQSFVNSNMDIRVKLVHAEEISYPIDSTGITDSDEYGQTLWRLMSKSDDYMNKVHTLRDRYSADFVHMFIENNAYGGLGYVNYEHHPYYAFSVSTVNQKTNNPLASAMRSCIHEIGHNMGLYHAPDNASPLYARGYNNPNSNPKIGTIMGGNYRNYWSSPDVLYNGVATGTAVNDARRAILENAHILANFRTRPVTSAPILWVNGWEEPERTFESNSTITVEGAVGYDVYVNGIKRGTINNDGYAEIVVPITTVYNDFEFKLQHVPSGTFSEVASAQIIKLLDTDNDGVFDYIEYEFGLDPNSPDSDGDGYSDFEEYGVEYIGGGTGGTVPTPPKDTDNDGIIDALDEDSDNDGVTDKDERLAKIVLVTIIVPYILN